MLLRLRQVNTPPAKAGGFGLRLKAGSAGTSADWSHLSAKRGSSNWEHTFHYLSSPSPQPSPTRGEGESIRRLKPAGLQIPYLRL